MSGVRERGEAIRRFIVEHVAQHPTDVVTFAAHELGISRQAVTKHIRHLTAQGAVKAEGTTRNRRYALAAVVVLRRAYPLPGLREDVVWRNDVAPTLSELPDNVRSIWQYGFTEMLNNAIEHSSGTLVTVIVTVTAASRYMIMSDDGEGIFLKIRRELGLDDERHAVLELAKGKLTTDQAHHTGEGIFFSSRMFDYFAIYSGDTVFSHLHDASHDWIMESPNLHTGTSVFMSLNNSSSRTMKEIFDRFASGDDYGFTKTIVPVRLALYGNEKLVSRSQAKRLLARFERFETVILDFETVDTIGQAFADEIFRVFPQEHPQVTIGEINATESVQQMINRALHHEQRR